MIKPFFVILRTVLNGKHDGCSRIRTTIRTKMTLPDANKSKSRIVNVTKLPVCGPKGFCNVITIKIKTKKKEKKRNQQEKDMQKKLSSANNCGKTSPSSLDSFPHADGGGCGQQEQHH